MTETASIGTNVVMDVDGVPAAAIVTHVEGQYDDGSYLVDVVVFPRGEAPRCFAGVHVHPDADSADADEHNLRAYFPTAGDTADVEQLGQDDAAAPVAPPAPAKKLTPTKAPARKATARR